MTGTGNSMTRSASASASSSRSSKTATARPPSRTTEDHLLHEEGLMRSTRYDAYDWHRQQHDTLRKRLRQFVPLIEDGDRQAALTLIEFLSKWLKDHTALADRMLGAHLRNQDRQHAA